MLPAEVAAKSVIRNAASPWRPALWLRRRRILCLGTWGLLRGGRAVFTLRAMRLVFLLLLGLFFLLLLIVPSLLLLFLLLLLRRLALILLLLFLLGVPCLVLGMLLLLLRSPVVRLGAPSRLGRSVLRLTARLGFIVRRGFGALRGPVFRSGFYFSLRSGLGIVARFLLCTQGICGGNGQQNSRADCSC